MCMLLKVKHEEKPCNNHGFRKNKEGKYVGYKVVSCLHRSPTFPRTWVKGLNVSDRSSTVLRQSEILANSVSKGFHVLASIQEAKEYKYSFEKIIRVLVDPKDVVATGWTENTNGEYLKTMVCTKCTTDLTWVE